MVRTTSPVKAIAAGVCCAVLLLTAARPVRADVIMTAAGLNETLKTMTRLTQQVAGANGDARTEAIFALGAEAAGLADLMNKEYASHGLQESALLNLAVERTKPLGITITVHEDEARRYTYDGSAFREYLKVAPAGSHAAQAKFYVIEQQFYTLRDATAAAVAAAAEAKRHFLAQYPTFDRNVDVRMFLAIDYRDLYRLARKAHSAPDMRKFRRLTRSAYQDVTRLYPDTEQGVGARELLRRFDAETQADR